MSKRIYVGNLDFTVKESELKDFFSEYGEVNTVNIITDKMTNRSKGFAFVEMLKDESADEAINALNGKEVSGREIKVNLAKERN
jgi:RNA recognition motif-containing protein